MKRVMFLLMAIAALALVVAGCKKKEEAAPTEEPAKTEEVKVEEKKEEPKVEPPKTEEKKEEAKVEEKKDEPAAAGDPEKDCGALHDMMQKMMAALTSKLGKGTTKGNKFPPREKFVEACKALPGPVVRCMNPEVAMKEGPKCQEVMKTADQAQIAKFRAVMTGK